MAQRTRYTVARYWSATSNAATYETALRAPRAADLLYSAVYAMLEADGILDRPRAHTLAAEANAAEVSPPPRGHLRRQVFYLREADRLGPRVEFTAERESVA